MPTSMSRPALARRSEKVRCADAWRRVVRSLRAYPHPRWRWHDLLRDQPRLDPLRVADEMIDAAIEAGAPVEDALAVADAWAASIRARYTSTARRPSLRQLVIEETEAEGLANALEHDLTEPTLDPFKVQRALEATRAHIHRETVLAEAAETYAFPRPMGVPSTTLRRRA